MALGLVGVALALLSCACAITHFGASLRLIIRRRSLVLGNESENYTSKGSLARTPLLLGFRQLNQSATYRRGCICSYAHCS